IAFLLGLFVALIFREHAELLNPLGVLLIRLLSLIAIPVIFLTVVLAVNKMNISQLGKLGGKLVLYYTITTALAVLIGVSLVLYLVFTIVSDDFFATCSTGKLMAILFIAIIMGIAMSIMIFSTDEKTRKYGDILNDFFESLNKMFYKILDGILLYAPVGVFAI